jgi:hypothetical protein
MMIGEALKCPREVFFWKTLFCTNVCNQSERDDESVERPLDCDNPDPETLDKTARMVTEAVKTGKPDALPLTSPEAAGNRPTPRLPQPADVFAATGIFCHPDRAANLSRTADDGGTLHSGALGAELEMHCQTRKRRLDILV